MTAPTEQPAPVPPFVGDDSALLIIDWSSWLHRAWAVHGLEMLPLLVGWLCSTLAHRPAHLVIALDAPAPTRRHHMANPLDPDWRYKWDRPPKPPEFHALCRRATEIAELHAIPCLWSEGSEADDVIASVTGQARALGYRVWIGTGDKDLHGLCEADAASGVLVGTWDRFSTLAPAGAYRGPAEVRAKWGVEPRQMIDLLAIAGDSSDGVPGVPGLGFDKASKILRAYDTLEAALVRPAAEGAEIAVEIRRVDAERGKLRKGGGDVKTIAAELKALRARIPLAWNDLTADAQALERDRFKLQKAATIARFSRDLTALDCDCGVSVPWDQTPVGGFDVEALRALYLQLGYTRKAEQIPTWRKRAPWALPFAS